MLHFAAHSSSGKSRLTKPHVISIAKEFSETPFGRYREEGPESGEVFRNDWLLPAFQKYSKIRLNIDGVEGLPSSFLEEVMGGLVRTGYTVSDLRTKLEWSTSQPDLRFYLRLAWKYADEQERKQRVS